MGNVTNALKRSFYKVNGLNRALKFIENDQIQSSGQTYKVKKDYSVDELMAFKTVDSLTTERLKKLKVHNTIDQTTKDKPICQLESPSKETHCEQQEDQFIPTDSISLKGFLHLIELNNKEKDLPEQEKLQNYSQIFKLPKSDIKKLLGLYKPFVVSDKNI